MGKTEAVVFLVTLCVSASLCQDILGTRILEERSVQDAISKVENLLKHLGDIKIKDVRGKSGDVSYEITNIRITHVDKPVPDVDFVDGFRKVNAKLSLPSLTATANWWARYKTWWVSITRSGSLTATASQVSVSVALVDFKVADCDARLNLSVDINGGGFFTWLAELFYGRSFVNGLESDIEDMICDAINKI